MKVPANFGDAQVTWTLKLRGETFAIPGSLHPNWQIDALEGEAGSGNTPPVIKFGRVDGRRGAGPGRSTAGPLTATVGAAAHAHGLGTRRRQCRQERGDGGRGSTPVTLTWFKHQGPGDVTFGAHAGPRRQLPAADGDDDRDVQRAGDYVLRVRANDASGVASAGHAQCCWTNGFVKVSRVTKLALPEENA